MVSLRAQSIGIELMKQYQARTQCAVAINTLRAMREDSPTLHHLYIWGCTNRDRLIHVYVAPYITGKYVVDTDVYCDARR